MIRKSLQTRERLKKYYKKKAEIDKTIEKLEQDLKEQENTEAGDIIRSYDMTIEELAEFLENMKGNLPDTKNGNITTEPEKEEETEEYYDEETEYDEI